MNINNSNKENVHALGQMVYDKLGKLINRDYIFLDLPYYTNIGDTLIWKGTEDFLEQCQGNCLYRASIETYIKPEISNEVIILLQGGGNFGDIWRRHTEHVMKVLKDFPDNKVIILPQTVHYNSSEVLKSDALQISKHKNLTICARDKNSFDILSQNFSINDVLLLPDMAFCIHESFLQKHAVRSKGKTLFFKRKDVEQSNYDFDSYIRESEVDTREWPSMDSFLVATMVLTGLSILRKRLSKINLFKRLTDWYAIHIYMPYLLRIGVRFMSSYEKVYSTRLHGAILGILLNKEMVFFDNSYGKNSSFFTCWLEDFNKVTFVPKELKTK